LRILNFALASNRILYCYPHMQIGKVWICCLLSVCLFVWLQIFPPRIMLVASNFTRWFIGVLGRKSHILVNFASPEAQNQTNQIVHSLATTRLAHPPCGSRTTHAGSALADSSSTLATLRISMRGYMAILQDGRTCFYCNVK